MSPLGRPNARLLAAACRARGLGVLDLGTGDVRAREELELAQRWVPGRFAVRVTHGCRMDPQDLPDQVDTVVLGWNSPWRIADLAGVHRVLVEVTGLAEASRAVDEGAHGLIARGNEAGGRVGEMSSFVLLQQLVAENRVPVWVCGGIGPHTAPAAVVGGAAGVVLDTQLALFAETGLPVDITAAITGSDGLDTAVVDGSRVLRRRGLPGAEALPVGQDVHLAGRFADRFDSVGQAVRGIRETVLAALDEERAGAAAAVLHPNSLLCRAIGTELPVAQGPMTRVSDQPAFAAAVAANGALPFVALALADEKQTRTLLDQTREAIPDRAWGVGVLGFAPEDVRAAQLKVIRALRPSCVIVAGGRPAQAAALEADGIPAFLHVPSPGLLRQFLDAGARRFVFEGAECGGHVGPRASFPLWEAQIGVLNDYLEQHPGIARDVQVFFAGGVHDARSAAMVAVAAESLAARGAGIGVLMGSAYLFTEEAVAHGAVRPVFQRQVLAAEATALLETAPGHATRCVASPFTERFETLREDLRARGLPDRQVWQELEEVNVGRLRIASKGVRRQGGELVSVAEPEQLAEGLFMAGQVAVLRSAVTTIGELHRTVTADAAGFTTKRTQALREWFGVTPVTEPAAPPPLDIAIVGMACAFGDAPDLAAFWANVVNGVDAVTEVPARRWDPTVYFGHGEGRTPSKWGGFLPEIPFDPLRYGIPPSSLAAIEPVQLLSLAIADRALADAGYAEGGFDRDRTSVVFGAEAGSDLSNATVLRTVLPSYLDNVPDRLGEQLPRLTEDTFPGSLANVIAGRIANRLDLGGANYTVDAACASSLAALDAACKELVAGTSDVVLAGGADLHNGINDYLMFASVQALSPTGRCATFDGSADGIALGEGVACVVLKRLADAERDGDRVYAVIKGIGSGSDGKSLGLTAPRPEGQRRALMRAYANARVSPAEVGLVEAHGTGTVVGDRTELATLAGMFGEAGAGPGQCAIGSVKSQIGHTKCAAGLAGLIKTAMALHTSTLPPTLHLSEPNPAWEAGSSPFSFSDRARPWPAPAAKRIAGVSAFGFGGTNFHVVLGAADSEPGPRHGLDQWPAELFTFTGTRDVEWLLELAGTGSWRLRDLAKTAARRAERSAEPVRVAIVASDVDELTALLRRAATGEHDPARGLFQASAYPGGKVAVLFPGQGSQRPGMLADLFVAFPEIQHFLRLGREWADAVFPPAAFGAGARQEQDLRLRDTRRAQPALGITGLAVHHLLTRMGVRADMFGGHSYGELVALCAAGSFDGATLLELSAARAESILSSAGADPGAMAAVAASADDVRQALREFGDDVVLANHNAPRQCVISGPTESIERVVAKLRRNGVSAKDIPVACAFHSPVLAGAGEKFAEVLAKHRIRPPETAVWANRTAAAYPNEAGAVRAELAAQIGAPVGFVAEIEAMYEAGARVFVEAGPGRVLSRLVDAVLGDRPHSTISCEGKPGKGIAGFLGALAQLAVTGVDLRTGWLFDGRDARDVSGERPAEPAGWTIDGHTVRTADGRYLAGGLTPARRVEEAVMAYQAPDGRDELVREFLRTSRETVAAQRDVLLSFLGAAPAVPPAPVAAPPVQQPAVPVITTAPAPPEPEDTDVLGTVRAVIGDRTGYPVDMIEPELDLEADLSVDSIKRTEIAGELLTRFGLTGADADELAKIRTTSAIADWFATRLGTGEPATTSPSAPEWTSSPPQRFTVERTGIDGGTADPGVLAGRTLTVAGGAADLVAALTTRLTALGASVIRDGESDGLIHLGALTPTSGETVPDLVPLFQTALSTGPRWLLAAAPQRGPAHLVGLRGLFRTLGREYPDMTARVVEVDPAAPADELASLLVGELLAADPAPVVISGNGVRETLTMTRTPLGSLGSTGAGPANDGAAEAAALGLGRESVVLLAGGARGITARFAGTLAAASGCRIELVGRTPLPTAPEHPKTAAAGDLAGLRSALAGLGHGLPAEIEREANRILAQREVAATLEALRGHVRYHPADVRDREAVHRVIKDVYAEYGRLDGVVCAAGIIEDKLFSAKEPGSFRRVYETKVDGAKTLLSAIPDDVEAPGFVVLFGSIAAVLGNRGQADYAAANDALESIGAEWAQRTGKRALTVHWGPWAPDTRYGGMVSTELGRSYAQRGIELIDPEEGALSLLRELAYGDPALRSVVYTASGW
ncbi:SDR family NAD(P)-dependent oxidoreductase [Amycolatopsis sp. K13G38]|uniref:SDR family NAD(P)-dependent oxidoreductase n=1 Tax=Amycolatopsis acididurans TaxID=2724524 RepID=A0ABX1JDR8_9PSEU|nr:type I polyketide synthase [Amycolatopsis acididurans]NKQ57888.1 SDR family NAD(P)-dependent oxidoreductase [Amycolatopsis acididurans]